MSELNKLSYESKSNISNVDNVTVMPNISMPNKSDMPIYLDYAATTPVDPRVASKMMESLFGTFGNPSSGHDFGSAAKTAVEEARRHVAALIKADPRCIIWTSGATEANNLAIKGVAQFYQSRGKHIVTIQTEHRAVLDTCQALAEQGFEITYLKPDKEGLINLETLESSLRRDTILVSIMHVNNEIGVLQDINNFGELLRTRNILFHVDAAQSVGKIPIDVSKLAVDLMSFSAHKLYGPKGVGALYVGGYSSGENHLRSNVPKVRLTPQIHGGGQERGLRSGTIPTHQCVGMGEAFRLAMEEMEAEQLRLSKLRALFWDGLRHLPGVFLNGHPDADKHLVNILNVCFSKVEKEHFQKGIKSLAVSSGSACTGSNLDTSHVLRAIGLTNELAHRSVRFSFGRYTTIAEIEYAVQLIREVYV